MRTLKVMLPAMAIGIGILVTTTASYGTQDYAKKEKKQCNFCHGKVEAKEAMQKNLTDAGKYYKEHNHSLEGYTKK